MTTVLSNSSEWSFEKLNDFDKEIAKIAAEYGLDTYPNQIEVISTEQMMDAYSAVGMPLGYNHWSFGKQFLSVEQSYKRGQMGLAYELVINSSPCIAYLMEENSLTMQALVIAHACYGHNSFFKNNYLFKAWTNADAIIDYLVFAKNYVRSCEEKHGVAEVEQLLDACHSLMNHGVDRYQRPQTLSMREEQLRQEQREKILQSQVNDLWRTVPTSTKNKTDGPARFPAEPQENLLYFFEKNAPLLEPWEREIIRIVRKMAQYFYPQRQTKVMNEGWATFWHYTLMHDLYDRGFVDDAFMMEFLHAHSMVVFQPDFNHPGYSGLNPYTLGFAIFTDLKRICEAPTEEDKRWFPDYAGTDWLKTLDHAMRNYKDESFISQFLSPKVIRDLRLFAIKDDDTEDNIHVTAIHNDDGYHQVRQMLAQNYDISNIDPDIQVWNVDLRGDRCLTLKYTPNKRRPLNKEFDAVMKYVHKLWRFDVRLVQDDGESTKELVKHSIHKQEVETA